MILTPKVNILGVDITCKFMAKTHSTLTVLIIHLMVCPYLFRSSTTKVDEGNVSCANLSSDILLYHIYYHLCDGGKPTPYYANLF